jgi:predicted transcriptional regulator
MAKMRFSVVASVNTESPEAVQPVLERLVSKGCVTRMGEKEFRIEAEMEGEDSKELNRSLLSELRRAERRTRLRAEWTCGETTERFFDYVMKKSTKTATR